MPLPTKGLSLALMGIGGDTSAEKLAAWPGIQRVPLSAAEVFTCKAFLADQLCDRLIRLIDINRRPSTIADPNGDDYFRTSETCDLDMADPAVEELEERLTAISGIAPEYGEPVQGQRYDVGQEFKAHTDYFDPWGRDYQRYCAISGQRTWTIMIYLNTVKAGGGTRFKELDKTFQPERGRLLAWNNRKLDGQVNPATLHHGMKVRKGVKYIITKWYRERPWG